MDFSSAIAEVSKCHKEESFFIYDLDGLDLHLKGLKTPGVKLWYASKANPLSSILKVALDAGIGIDCASLGEMEQALACGARGSQLLLTGPGKTREFFKLALKNGVETFVLESILQAKILNEEAALVNQKVKALLRLQMAWDQNEFSVLGGNEITAFGLDHSGWLGLPSVSHIQIIGVHNFQWGNILSASRLGEIWQKVSQAAKALARDLKFPLKVLDLGGGLGIPYQQEKPLEWTLVQAELAKLRTGDTEIWLELGRYAVGAFGEYVTQVIDRKTVAKRDFLVLAGGSQHILRPALVKQGFPARLVRNSDAPKKIFSVHGPLCTAIDQLGCFEFPEDIGPNDQICFGQTGAYGFTESMPYFLCHQGAAEWIFKNGKLTCVRNAIGAASWLV